MTLDLDQLRNDTPACQKLIHLNNAGASLPPNPVLDTVLDHLRLEAQLGAYEAAESKSEQVAGVYQSVASLINAHSHEIALMESATMAWDRAFYGINFQAGDTILTGMNEYASNFIAMLQLARQKGVNIEIIANDDYGQIDLLKLANRIDKHTKLIALTHVPTHGGLVNPAEKVGMLAQQAGVCFLLDACQSAGQMALDVNALHCDLLTATGRKYLRGPRGSGFLYVRQGYLDQLEPPCLDLHAASWDSTYHYTLRDDARRFETWEHNVAARLGLGAAIDYALHLGVDRVWFRIKALADLLRLKLKDINNITVQDLGLVQCGIVSFSIDQPHLTADDLKLTLRQQHINVSTSTLYGARLDMQARGLKELMRASVHYYNTEQELDSFIKALDQWVNG